LGTPASKSVQPRAPQPDLIVLMPVYNDWHAASLLLADLDRVLADARLSAHVVLVDDGSTVPPTALQGLPSFRAIGRADILSLRRNLGHQRAIAIALAWVAENVPPGPVVVMDGDGEDAPSDVPRLLARSRETGGHAVVFAERRRRSEGLVFKTFYHLYRFWHLWLTGISVRVGNFSLIPAAQLRRLVVVSELWNHYAAAVFKARLPREFMPTQRAHRLSGQSQMNFVALVGHGLSALSVHAEIIGVRLLMLALTVVVATVMLLVGVVAVRLGTAVAIPGWTTTAFGILLVLLFQATAFAGAFVFLVLHARSQPTFIPLRDYVYFVNGIEVLWPREPPPEP
jgi:polyisoprenyl-phosphate glycosyltransferase